LTDAAASAAKTTMRAYHSTTRVTSLSQYQSTDTKQREEGEEKEDFYHSHSFPGKSYSKGNFDGARSLAQTQRGRKREIASAEVEFGGRGRGVEGWRRDGTAAVKIATEKCFFFEV